MSGWAEHLIIVPIVLPLAVGAALLLLDERRDKLKAGIATASCVALLATAIALLLEADLPSTRAYALGDWDAPFGIVLVADRLSALMLVLTATLGLAALLFSLARWHRVGPRFQSLFQFQLMGINGAFLTGDLFNLFVFFELLLAASYGLALHGSGTQRVSASLHYLIINLTASLLFLVGASMIYGVTGTLNMADIAMRMATLSPADKPLMDAAAAILAVAFLVKAGMWPLGFWLPPTYAAASAPAAALFSILSKVGVYAVLRVWLLFYADGFGNEWLLAGGIMTLIYGLIGVLASQNMGRMAGYCVLISSGTLLAIIGTGHAGAAAAALYYLVVSTLSIGAFFLLIELIERMREPGADVLDVTAAFFGLVEQEEEEEVGLAIPGTMATLGLGYICCALLLAGLPPLPAFLAKAAMLGALLQADPVPGTVWTLLALVILSGFAVIIAMSRTGSRIFWAQDRRPPRVRVIEAAPVALLLGLCIALALQAGPAMRYMQDTVAALHAPADYIKAVLPPP